MKKSRQLSMVILGMLLALCVSASACAAEAGEGSLLSAVSFDSEAALDSIVVSDGNEYKLDNGALAITTDLREAWAGIFSLNAEKFAFQPEKDYTLMLRYKINADTPAIQWTARTGEDNGIDFSTRWNTALPLEVSWCQQKDFETGDDGWNMGGDFQWVEDGEWIITACHFCMGKNDPSTWNIKLETTDAYAGSPLEFYLDALAIYEGHAPLNTPEDMPAAE